MAEESSPFADLMRRVQEGSEEAARALVDEYGPHILRVVRRRLHQKMRSKFDSADFVQAVWASFFAQRSELGTFQQAEEVVAYLVALAQNKVVDEARHQLGTCKRALGREQSFDDSRMGLGQELAAPQPTPSEVAMAHEMWDHLVQGKPVHYQQILALRRLGFTYDEIAARLGLNERTVRRVLQELLPKHLP